MLALLVPSFSRAADAEATVTCKDGATSKGGRGACRGHGGVDKAATAKTGGSGAAAPAKGEAKTSAKKGENEARANDAVEGTVLCKDGATSKGGRGACRGHGGVDKGASAKDAGATATEAESTKATGRKNEAAAEKAGEATVLCKDGATSKGGRGACRGHGGVDKAATAKAGGAPTAGEAASPPPPTTAPPKTTAPAKTTEPANPKTTAPQADEKQPDGKEGPPTARCKDGTLSYAKHHTGACSRHGGVDAWLDKK
jgi:hypothetical protein